MSEVIDEGFSFDPNMTEESVPSTPIVPIPPKPIYSVYILTDKNGGIVSVESTAFHTAEELENGGYVKIDEGTDGSIYGHAQPNYMREKYGEPVFDNAGRPNFKYVDGTITAFTDEEKAEFYTASSPSSGSESTSDLLKELEDLKARMLLIESEVK